MPDGAAAFDPVAGKHDLSLRSARRLRLVPLAVAASSMAVGLWVGLVRLGLALPGANSAPTQMHGALMICGFLGTLISLERAVALGGRWAYAAPALSGAGALAIFAGMPGARRRGVSRGRRSAVARDHRARLAAGRAVHHRAGDQPGVLDHRHAGMVAGHAEPGGDRMVARLPHPHHRRRTARAAAGWCGYQLSSQALFALAVLLLLIGCVRHRACSRACAVHRRRAPRLRRLAALLRRRAPDRAHGRPAALQRLVDPRRSRLARYRRRPACCSRRRLRRRSLTTPWCTRWRSASSCR